MLDEAVAEFLSRHNQVFLLTRRRDGWPTGYPMVGIYRDEGVEFSTYRASAKVTRVLRDGRASCLVVPRGDASDEPCLWVRGPAAIRDDAATVPRDPEQRAGAERLEVPASVTAKVARREQEGKRCLLRVEIDEHRWIAPRTSAP